MANGTKVTRKPSPATGQNVGKTPTAAKAPKDQPVPVRTLRRIAEAADGFRTGNPFWLVSRLKPDANFNYHITKHDTEDDANTRLAQATREGRGRIRFARFGPFEPGDGGGATSVTLPRKRVENVILKIEGGREFDVGEVLKRRGLWTNGEFPADMIVWSQAAFEKFAETYYYRLLGQKGVDHLRTQFNKGSVVGIIHLPTTDYTESGNLTTYTGVEQVVGLMDADVAPQRAVPR